MFWVNTGQDTECDTVKRLLHQTLIIPYSDAYCMLENPTNFSA